MNNWHTHEFLPGVLTPRSCQVCGHATDMPWHTATNRANWRWDEMFKPWRIYGGQ